MGRAIVAAQAEGNMTVSRRQVLGGAVAGLLLPGVVRAGSDLQTLTAAPALAQIAPQGYPATRVWAYDGTLPGRPLHIAQGARLRCRVTNQLDQPTAVHWHGIRIDNAMDGVPGLTQQAIAPGATFDYDFALPDAGTYWYHTHAQTVEQMARGLYGPLIVHEASPPDVDRDEVLMLDDMRLDDDAQIAPFGNFHDLSHAGRLGNVVLTNGVMDMSLPAQRHQRLRLRLVNAANARVFRLSLQGMTGWTVALDGMPLDVPEPVDGPFWLAPAQRIDLIVDITAESGDAAHLVHMDRDEGYSQVAFPVQGQVAAAPRSAPVALSPNSLPSPDDRADALHVPLVMNGGAMRGLQTARWNGADADMRILAQAGQFWALNGQVGRDDTPLADLALGETCVIALRNDTAFPHAMHLHGHHFRQVRADGSLGPWRDTFLSFPGDAHDLAFVADNPGRWLVHCHMLSHHAAGMGTWINVRG
jgi:FtsP/CotA-like multicopper oxidase with cupredoxin domain